MIANDTILKMPSGSEPMNQTRLVSIPGVGPKIAQKLQLVGIREASDLKDANPEKLKWWNWKDSD